MILDLLDTFSKLEERQTKVIKTEYIKKFMTTELDQNYRRGDNSIYWFQLFLNGSWLEDKFKLLNNDLNYKENNHGVLGEQKRGNNIPDFVFKINDKEYTLDTKTFSTLEKFNDVGKSDNNAASKFENADFVVAFIMEESDFYFRYKLANSKQYTVAAKMSEMSECFKSLIGWINLPKQVKMIKFAVSMRDLDSNISDELGYSISEYNLQ